MASASAASLNASVTSLRLSLNLLESSISILDNGVTDFPRMGKVLASTRHFELTNESSLANAQAEVVAEIAPEVQRLLGRVESHLDKLERREQALVAKAELQAGRLDSGKGRKSIVPSGARSRPSMGANKVEDRYRMLRSKKERLGYAVERLNLQAQQRERQLRMSMAAQ